MFLRSGSQSEGVEFLKEDCRCDTWHSVERLRLWYVVGGGAWRAEAARGGNQDVKYWDGAQYSNIERRRTEKKQKTGQLKIVRKMEA